MKFLSLAIVLCLAVAGIEAHSPTHSKCLDLQDHSSEFEQKIYKVTDGVYVAVGYGIANSILLEGEDGVIIVDTMESKEAAEPVKKAFDAITGNKPVKAIIYTHNHADHTFGASVFAGDNNPDIISHHSTLRELSNILNVIQPIIYTRSMRQFGCYLPHEMIINDGIGPHLEYTCDFSMGLVIPNKTFRGDHCEMEIAGIKMVLYHAPGETDDQIFVWLPEKRVLLPGDNFYKAFPNLYAIRGTSKRDVVRWIESLDKMRALNPEFLVPSHTKPISGSQSINQHLTCYRDAIQYVHDQTVYYMNKGLCPDEIVERVRLPEHLKSDPYLQEYYGMVEWSVRSIFTSYLGWFSGRACDLFPHPLKKQAQLIAELAGGEGTLAEQAGAALAKGEYQWAIQLAEHVLQLDPKHEGAKDVKVKALFQLASEQRSANARNYLFTQALEAKGDIEIDVLSQHNLPLKVIHAMPVENLFNALKVTFNCEACKDESYSIGIHLTDLDTRYSMHLRNGVLEVQVGDDSHVDLMIHTSSICWKELVVGYRTHVIGEDYDWITLQGDHARLHQFLGMYNL